MREATVCYLRRRLTRVRVTCTGVSPVHCALGAALPGFGLQEVADGVSVGEELCVGVKSHCVHSGRTPADLRPLGA